MSTRTFLKRLRVRGLAGADGGPAAIEFALLSPLFLLVFVGKVDIGNILYTEYRPEHGRLLL